MGCACSKGDPSAASAPAADAKVMAGDDKDKDYAAGEIQEHVENPEWWRDPERWRDPELVAADLQDIEWLEGEAPAEEPSPEEEATTVRTATKRRTLIWQLRLAREAAQKREHKTHASPELNPVGTVVNAVVNLSHRVFGRESTPPDPSPGAPAGATNPTRRGEVDETDEAGAGAVEGGDSGVESGEEGYADGGDGGGADGGVADGAGASSRRHRSRRVDWRLRVAREAQQQRELSHRQRRDSHETLGADTSPHSTLPATVEEGGVSPRHADGSAGFSAELGGADSGHLYDGADEGDAPSSAPVDGEAPTTTRRRRHMIDWRIRLANEAALARDQQKLKDEAPSTAPYEPHAVGDVGEGEDEDEDALHEKSAQRIQTSWRHHQDGRHDGRLPLRATSNVPGTTPHAPLHGKRSVSPKPVAAQLGAPKPAAAQHGAPKPAAAQLGAPKPAAAQLGAQMTEALPRRGDSPQTYPPSAKDKYEPADGSRPMSRPISPEPADC